MEERKLVQLKKEEFGIREYIKSALGKGKISKVKIKYTPIGEKIIVSTNKPGLVIGKRGEKIEELTRYLKEKFKLENPHIEIEEIINPDFDSQLIADEIALNLERLGPLKFKIVAYKVLQRVMDAGALGIEIRLCGKLPSERAKMWRFQQGFLKKIGDSAKVVDKAQAISQTKPGVVGIQVSILPPYAKIHDKITINEELLNKLRANSIKNEVAKEESEKTKEKKIRKKKVKVEDAE